MYTDNNSFEAEYAPFIDDFFSTFKIGSVLHGCGGAKLRGISSTEVLKYLFSVVFTNTTMAHDQEINKNAVKKDTCHRLLESPKIDWNKLLAKLATAIAKELEEIRPKDCTGKTMPAFFILDDSSFYRNRSKCVELTAKCWDHALNSYFKGFRMLTLEWSDGKTALPVAFCNMSSENKENRINDMTEDETKIPENSFGMKIRKFACQKMSETMIDLIKEAQANGMNARYILCDRWFSSPKSIFSFMKQGLDVITMLKQDSTRYIFEGKELKIKEIFKILVERDRVKRRMERRNGNFNGRKWQYSAKVTLFERDGEGKKEVTLIFVQNRNKKSEFLTILCTDTNLTPEQIIEYFGCRWAIETSFQTLKSCLRLQKSTQSIDYMQIHASTAIAMLQFQMLAYRRRTESDEVSYGALFLFLVNEFSDAAMKEALTRLLSLFAQKVSENFSIPLDSIMAMVDEFIAALPNDIKHCLIKEEKTA